MSNYCRDRLEYVNLHASFNLESEIVETFTAAIGAEHNVNTKKILK